jgi:hypothetical protein
MSQMVNAKRVLFAVAVVLAAACREERKPEGAPVAEKAAGAAALDAGARGWFICSFTDSAGRTSTMTGEMDVEAARARPGCKPLEWGENDSPFMGP